MYGKYPLEIQKNHSLTRGLLACYPLLEQSPRTAHTLSGRDLWGHKNNGSFSTLLPSFSSSSFGVSVPEFAPANSQNFRIPRGVFSWDGMVTFHCWFLIVTSPTQDSPLIDNQWGNENSGGFQIYIQGNGVGMTAFAGDLGGRQNTSFGSGLTTNTWYCFFFEANAHEDYLRIWINNTLWAQNTSFTRNTVDGGVVNSSHFFVSSNCQNGHFLHARIFNIMFWNRILANREKQMLYYDPFVLYGQQKALHFMSFDSVVQKNENDSSSGGESIQRDRVLQLFDFTVNPVFFDDFENGNVSRWTSVYVTSPNQAIAQSSVVLNGSYSLKIKAVGATNGEINLYRDMPSNMDYALVSFVLMVVQHHQYTIDLVHVQDTNWQNLIGIKMTSGGEIQLWYIKENLSQEYIAGISNLSLNTVYQFLLLWNRKEHAVGLWINNSCVYFSIANRLKNEFFKRFRMGAGWVNPANTGEHYFDDIFVFGAIGKSETVERRRVLSLSDVLGGLDSVSYFVQMQEKFVSEGNATTGESLSLALFFALLDSSGGSEFVSQTVSFLLQEYASATEVLLGSFFVFLSEYGSIQEFVQCAISLLQLDSSVFLETIGMMVMASVLDAASSSDTTQLLLAISLFSQATGTDLLSVLSSVFLSDVRQGEESISLFLQNILLESGSFSESMFFLIKKEIEDVVFSTESIASSTDVASGFVVALRNKKSILSLSKRIGIAVLNKNKKKIAF